jgi:hypothetical protein
VNPGTPAAGRARCSLTFPPHCILSFRLSSISSVAYRSYSCCSAKIGDFAGGPDHLSSFAPSDQLSHLNNCFDLFSLSLLHRTRLDAVALSLLSHITLFLLFQRLLTFLRRYVVIPIDCVCASVLYFCLFIIHPNAPPRCPSLFLTFLPPWCESMHPTLYVSV